MLHILSEEVCQFIREHEHDDEKLLVLQHKIIHGIPSRVVAEQIAARRKAKYKLPTYYQTPGIVFPPAVNLEQSSSEETAYFKRNVLAALVEERRLFKRGVDLTGGLGVDAYVLSGLFEQFEYVEPERSLLELARSNHRALGVTNLSYHHASAETFLVETGNDYEVVFVDPSRRANNKRVSALMDASPNIIGLQTKIFSISRYLLLKAAPLLDIRAALNGLMFVKAVYVVAVDNDVKELLFLAERNFSAEPVINAVNLRGDRPSEHFEFLASAEALHSSGYADPRTFLYEPNAAILKAGAFRSISDKYPVSKIHPNTHLYTSDEMVADFPGRIFRIEALTRAAGKDVRPFFPRGQANVITRNFPLTVEEICRKTGIREGGDRYLIAFSGLQKKIVAVAARLK